MGLPVLRTLSLCTCCRHYPGAADGRIGPLGNPAVSAVIGSACASSFSRLARRSLALRPAHSRCHQFVTRYPKASAISFPPQLLRLLPAGAVCRVGLAPTGKRRLATAHAKSGLQVTVWTLPSLRSQIDGRGRYCPLALWSNALSTASVIAVTPVWMVGFGTGANSGECLPGSGVPLLLAAAHFSGSYTPIW